ncbi:MAG: hypothetical protein JW820_00125 [Spirochaetales bacterium]|nr:hypothetical protein [Spirochaetales bacterium]
MKKSLWIVVILLIASQALWAQFYTKLPTAERRELAEAYYLAGRQYESRGERDKGEAFQDMAYNIYPALDPSRIQMRELPDAAMLILEGKARLAAAPSEDPMAVEERLKSRFLRLVSSFLVEDSQSMLNLMDGSVYFSEINAELTQGEMRRQLEAFFADVDLRGLVPTQVFDLNSLTVSRVSPAQARNWGETYAIRVQARMDFSKQVAFWTTDQQYLMHKVDNRWLLFAVGQRLPLSSWVPQEAPATSARAVPAALAPMPTDALRDNLLAALGYFLRKEPDRAATYFAEEVRIIRMDTSLTRREIAETFRGYFEAADFSGVTAQDIVDPGSIFVQPTDRFAGEVAAPVYLLTVKTRLDLSAKIPFWTRFQDYYFNRQAGDWKIFAIF